MTIKMKVGDNTFEFTGETFDPQAINLAFHWLIGVLGIISGATPAEQAALAAQAKTAADKLQTAAADLNALGHNG